MQFIWEISLGNICATLGIGVFVLLGQWWFGRKIGVIERELRQVEDIIQHRDFKEEVKKAIVELKNGV